MTTNDRGARVDSEAPRNNTVNEGTPTGQQTTDAVLAAQRSRLWRHWGRSGSIRRSARCFGMAPGEALDMVLDRWLTAVGAAVGARR